MHIFTFIVFTSLIISCTPVVKTNNQTLIFDTSLRVLVHGLPDESILRARNTIGRKYGIKFYQVAGCTMDSSQADSVRKVNDSVFNILDQRIGKGSCIRLKREVDSMIEIQANILKIVTKQKLVVSQSQQVERLDSHLCFAIDFTKQTDFFIVYCFYNNYKSKNSLVDTSLSLLVNLRDNSANILSFHSIVQ